MSSLNKLIEVLKEQQDSKKEFLVGMGDRDPTPSIITLVNIQNSQTEKIIRILEGLNGEFK